MSHPGRPIQPARLFQADPQIMTQAGS